MFQSVRRSLIVFFSQATVERDQTQIELTETQKRLKKLIDEMNEKIAQERQNAERACDERLKENAEKVNRSTIQHQSL